jgi:hypothetical protein
VVVVDFFFFLGVFMISPESARAGGSFGRSSLGEGGEVLRRLDLEGEM